MLKLVLKCNANQNDGFNMGLRNIEGVEINVFFFFWYFLRINVTFHLFFNFMLNILIVEI